MTGRGYIPAQVLAALIEPSLKAMGVAAFAARCGLSESYIRKIRAGIAKTVHPDRADLIISGGLQQPELWWADDALTATVEARTMPRWIIDTRYRKGGYWR